MIQWARLNEDNIIVDITISEDSVFGGDWLAENFGGIWTELPNERGLGLGGYWDETRQAFIPFKSYPSWILNEQTLVWEAPVPKPNDDGDYGWDEQAVAWKEVTNG